MSRSFDLSAEALQKDLGRLITARAIRAGVLVRGPCEVAGCGKTPAQAHHEDYSEPLKIKWLCQQHHTELHARERAAKAPPNGRTLYGWPRARVWSVGSSSMTIPECFS